MQKILVSSCLLGHKVRFDGKHCFSDHPLMLKWKKLGLLVPFCPEVAAGMPTPRPAVEIVNQQALKIIDENNQDYTEQFLHGAQLAVNKAVSLNIKVAILKSKSPSCGKDMIYDGNFKQQLISGQGVTAKLMQENNITLFTEQQLTELDDLLKTME
ncbi:MAG: DUF523 domain-containing protein [Oceanospirillaceae bacterium]